MIKLIINILEYMYLKIRFGKQLLLKDINPSHYLPKIYINGLGAIGIGSGFMAERNTSIESYNGGNILIGNNVFLNSNVKIVSRESIKIGSNTMIGPNVCIYDHNHDIYGENKKNNFVSDKIMIGENVWIGANAIILKGSNIEDNAVIGAGTIVKETVQKNQLYMYKQNISKKHISEKG